MVVIIKLDNVPKTQHGFLTHTAAAAKSLQLCPTLCDPHRRQPIRLLCPWDSPGKNTGVGCHFLLQCMKVESEREVAQLCLTLCNPMDCSLPGSSIHGSLQARVLEWVASAFSVLHIRVLKIELLYVPAISLLAIYPKTKSTNSKRYMHLNIHNSIICTCQALEAT